MTQFVEQLRNQAKWYAQPGHNARDLMDSHLLEKAADEIERLAAKLEAAEKERDEFKRACFGHISDNSMLRAKIAEMEQQEPDEVMVVLDRLDDYIARIEGNDRGACGLINSVRRYLLDAAEVGGNK